MSKVLTDNYKAGRKHFAEELISLKKYIVQEFKITEKELNNYLSFFRLRNDIMFHEKSETEYQNGLYNGAKDQAANTIKTVIKKMLEGKEIDKIKFLDCLLEFENLELFVEALQDDYEESYLGKFIDVHEDWDRDYYILLNKSNDAYEASQYIQGSFILSYELTDADRANFKEKYDLDLTNY